MTTALVTGAAGGIGTAICRTLLNAGYRVAATDVDPRRLLTLEKNLNVNKHLLSIQMDVTDGTSVRAAVTQAAASDAAGIALLVNNAGGISKPSLRTTREQDWQADLDLNLTGAWRCMDAVREQMIQQKQGVIVNVASVNGLGIFGHPGYSVAKAGLIHLTRFAAVELGKFGIRCNAVCPGTVRTDAWAQRASEQPKILDDVCDWYPSRSICDPGDVAAAVSFLAQSGTNLNGAVLALDGGLTSGSDRVASAFTGVGI